MVKFSIIGLAVLAVILSSVLAADAQDAIQFFSLETGGSVSRESFMKSLAAQQIVLVGERHDMASHHHGQLEVIKILVAERLPVAIGMEMMRSDSQAFLDAWVAGELDEYEFQAVYRDNWNFPWALYRPIFVFARDQQIPIIGLNVPRGITRQVAREGFDSLSASQRQGLPFVACRVDEDYMAYIRQAYGAHGHGNMRFEHFCEAQLIWDKAMAANALQYIANAPERLMVILAGTGHVRKGGIPRQIETLGDIPYKVVLPEIPSILDPRSVDAQDADFLLQGL